MAFGTTSEKTIITIVIDVNGNTYTIEFVDGNTDVQNVNQLLVYFPCDCN